MPTLESLPDPLDWVWYVGDTRPETFVITGETSVDLTGATILAQVRKAKKDPVVAATAVIGLTDLANGTFTVGWDAAELRALVDAETGTEWVGVWDLQVTSVGGEIETHVGGAFTAVYDVSRAA